MQILHMAHTRETVGEKDDWEQKVQIYLKYNSVCTLVGIGTPPPLAEASMSHPSEPKEGGGHTRLGGEGVAESHFGRLEKKPYTLSSL
jgi:hypothetical protein